MAFELFFKTSLLFAILYFLFGNDVFLLVRALFGSVDAKATLASRPKTRIVDNDVALQRGNIMAACFMLVSWPLQIYQPFETLAAIAFTFATAFSLFSLGAAIYGLIRYRALRLLTYVFWACSTIASLIVLFIVSYRFVHV